MKKAELKGALTKEKYGKIKVTITGSGKKLSVWVEETRKILLCLSDVVRVLLDGEILTLAGKDLVCVTYVGAVVEISGMIHEIRFEHVASSL